MNGKAAGRSVAPEPTGLSWLLWVVVAATPWLLPIHSEPWPAFYSEALAAAAVLPIAAWTLVRGGGVWRLDGLSVLLMALALIPLLQAGVGMYVLAGEAWVVSLCLVGLAFTVGVARKAEELVPLRLADMLFAAIALAALVSTALSLYQWLGQDWLGSLVAFPEVAGRSYANLGQPNNLATLLCWGLVATWWFFARARIRGRTALLAAVLLLAGVALTRSRTGWIEVLLLGGAAVYVRRKSKSGPNALAVVALLAGFTLIVVALGQIGQGPHGGASAQLRDQTSVGKRPLIWKLALDEISQRPWAGYGWNQGVVAHMTLAERHPDLQVTIQHAHSLPLDLLVWNGVPLGLLIIGALAWWAVSQWRACRTEPQRLLLLALAVFLSHALVELPHAYLFFLIPVAIMMGTLNALGKVQVEGSVSRPVAAMVATGLAVATTLAVNDYRGLEANLLRLKLRAAHIHNPHPAPFERLVVLAFLQTALERLYLEPSKETTAADLALLKRTLERYPSTGGFMRYAQASALRGDSNEARWALARTCLLNTKSHCEAALKEWDDLSRQIPEMALIAPTLPTK